VVEVNEGVCRPKLFAQFFSGDDVAGVLKENDQEPKGLLLQLDLDAVLAQFACTQVQFEETEANGPRPVGVHHVQPSAGFADIQHGKRQVQNAGNDTTDSS
jgi:hypothetical protein